MDHLRAFGLSNVGTTRVSEFSEEITILSEPSGPDGVVVYIKKEARKPTGPSGGVIGPICKKCYFDPKTGIEVCKIIDCPPPVVKA